MSIDLSFAKMMNDLLHHTNGALTGLFKVITYFGNSGIGFIIITVILLLFKKTRARAFCMGISFLIGFISFELITKNIVRRPRPFMDETSVFYTYWQAAGSVGHSGFSFPSGHTTIAMEFAIIMFLTSNKKYSWIYFIIPIIMGITRTYFMVHYLTDVLAGLLCGTISVLLSLIIYHYIGKMKWHLKFLELPNFFYVQKNKEEN